MISIDEAVALLRSSDPAEALPPLSNPATAVAALRERVHGAAMPGLWCGDLLDAVGPRSGLVPGKPEQRKRGWLAAALAGAAVVLVSIGTLLIVRGPGNANPGVPGAPTPVASATESHRDQTLSRLQQLLDAGSSLPGAVRVSQPPVAALAGALPVVGSTELSTAWVTAPGSAAAAVAYYRAHATEFAATLRVSAPNPSDLVTELRLEGADTPAYQSPTLDIAIASVDGGIALRLIAGAWVVPERPADEYAREVTSVDVTVNRPSAAPTVRRSVTGSPARQLAEVFNGLRLSDSAGRSCPLSAFYPGTVDVLIFHSPRSVIIATVGFGSCVGTSVTVNGKASALLASGSLAIDAQSAIGLSANYGIGKP